MTDRTHGPHGAGDARLWAAAWNRRLVIGQLVPAAFLAVTWAEVRSTADLGRQIHWLNVGVMAVAVAMVSAGLWLREGRHRLTARRRRVLPDTRSSRRDGPALAEQQSAGTVLHQSSGVLHRPDCPVVLGKPVVAAASGADGTYRPCRICSDE